MFRERRKCFGVFCHKLYYPYQTESTLLYTSKIMVLLLLVRVELQDFKEIEQAGVEFDSKNSQKIVEDIRERGSEVVFNELKQGTHELSPPKEDAPKETIKKDAPSPKKGTDLSLEGLTKQGKPRPTKDGYIQTYVNKDKTKVFDVYLNKQLDVINKVPK